MTETLTIKDCFSDLTDPRIERTKKYLLIDIITIALCSIISGGSSFNDMELFGKTKEKWLRGFLKLPHGIPSHDTFRRVMSSIKPEEFNKSFFNWISASYPETVGSHIAIDGKVLKSSARKRKDISAVHLVSAWRTENSGLILGQVKTDNKSNEIKAIPELLNALSLKGAIVTIDAMGCQREIAKNITEQQGDYILALKGNQKKIHQEVQSHFKNEIEPDLELHNTEYFHDYFEDKYGRIVRRRTWVINEIDKIKSLKNWPGVHSIIAVEGIRQTHKEGEVSTEYRYFLSSIEGITAKQADKTIRNHWAIENHLHWSLDVVFSEDSSRIMEENAVQNVGLLRRIGVSLLKKENSGKISLKQKTLKCALDEKYLKKVLEGISDN